MGVRGWGRSCTEKSSAVGIVIDFDLYVTTVAVFGIRETIISVFDNDF